MGALSVVAGRYQLEGLAQPGDASTFVATDSENGAAVLVCLVTADASGAARTRRAIEHPALLRVRDVIHGLDKAAPPIDAPHGRASGFVVLDLPESETLAGRVERKGKLELPPAVRTIVALTNALAAIHAEGAIHGSVVPEALELRTLEDGGPRLGLAGVSDLSLAYESPPRLCGEGASEGDDVWALLGCLYFAVTGVAPFAAESPAALARRILGGRPMPITTQGPPAVALQKIFDRGFSRTAGLRYASAEELREDLLAWLSRHGSHHDAPMVSAAPPPNPATTTARRKNAIDADLLRKAVPSDRPWVLPTGDEPMKLANKPLDRQSDRPPATLPGGAAPADRPTEGAIPASRRSESVPAPDQLTSDYPKITAPRSIRHQTAPWGAPLDAVTPTAPQPTSEPAPPVAVREVDPHRPQTAWPSAALRAPYEEPPVTPRSATTDHDDLVPPSRSPEGVATPSEPTLTAIPRSRAFDPIVVAPEASADRKPQEGFATPSEPTLTAIPRSRAFEATPADETVRISRDQLTDLESESRRPQTSDSAMAVAANVLDAGLDAAKGPSPERQAKTDPPAPRTSTRPPPVGAPAHQAPPSRPTGTLLAFMGGVAVAGALGVAFVTLRERPPNPVAVAAPNPTLSARPVSDRTVASSSANAPPQASSSAGVASTDGVAACVSRWFPPETFESSADLGWVCDASDGRRAQRDMQRAVVAGGRGLKLTEGMKDWARYRWFQYPVLLTMRNACCPNATKLDLPRGSPACPSASESITPLGVAAAKRDGDIDAPIRQLRRMASCMAETGDAALFGIEGPMSGGEETLFRAFVERGRR